MNGADLIARAPAVADKFALACAASRLHFRAATAALETYGRHGPFISGCVRAHFPESVKSELRSLARLVGHYSDAARAARPPRMRHATVRRIGQAIATRDGAGYYGPQPERPGALLQAGLQLALPGDRATVERESGQ